MKLSLLLLLPAISSAFAPAATFRPRLITTTTSLDGDRTDATEAINAALEASKKYGSTSAEARTAWEVVEELDGNDDSAAYTGGVTDSDLADTTSDPAAAVLEYEEKISLLATMLETQKAKIESVKTLAQEIRAVKMTTSTGAVGRDSAQMRAALDDAKRVTEEGGIESPEAKLAWEAVEEIASGDLTEATKGSLDEECLTETIEACEALEELGKVLGKK